MSSSENGHSQHGEKRGSLTAVGTGIRAVGQLTVEAIAHMRAADKLLYCVGDPIAEHIVKSMNENGAESMFHYYEENKPRSHACAVKPNKGGVKSLGGCSETDKPPKHVRFQRFRSIDWLRGRETTET